MIVEVSVNASTVTISNKQSLQINSGGYNINECIFTFTQEYNGLLKRAVFSNVLDTKYLVEIKDNQCIVPSDILQIPGIVYLGVYAYTVDENNELSLRYSPTPDDFNVELGSYSDNAAKVVSKETALDLIKRVDDLVVQTDEAITNINNLVTEADEEINDFIVEGNSKLNSTIAEANTTLDTVISDANTAINSAIGRADSAVTVLTNRVDVAIDRTNTAINNTNTAIAKVNSITFELDENGYLILTEND